MTKHPTSNVQRSSTNSSLSRARNAKQDEFYTQYIDIQKEVEAYLEYNPDTFREKIVYCNCDDPFESNFFKYFAANFNRLGLKKLITTSYDGSPIASAQLPLLEYTEGNGKRPKPKAIAVIVDQVTDEDGDGAANIDDVKLFLKRNKAARKSLKADDTYGGGDFRSADCVALLKEADIVVTNPPFSLFREYVAQLVEHGKKLLVIGNQNAITYKEIFPLIKDNKLWLGVDNGGTKWFQVQNDYDIKTESRKKIENGIKYFSMGSIMWFTNLDHGRRHLQLSLMTMTDNFKFSKHKEIRGKATYDQYANYDAIDVPFTDAIPSDYAGAMGVPITFLDKYSPEQFEILGSSRTLGGPMSKVAEKGAYLQGGPRFYIANDDGTYRRMYDRIVIRHRHPTGKK